MSRDTIGGGQGGAAAFVAYSGRIVSRTRPVPCARCIRRRLNYACAPFLGGKVYPGLYGGGGDGGGGGRERVARATFAGWRRRPSPARAFFSSLEGWPSRQRRTRVTATGRPFVLDRKTYLPNDVRDNDVFVFYLPITSEMIRMSGTRTNKTKG